MTKEDFNLLLTDIYPRLRYGLVVRCDAGNCTLSFIAHSKTLGYFGAIEEYDGYDFPIDECKPYLRPMSSMTEEERLELSRLSDGKFKFYIYAREPEIICYEKYNYLEGLKVLEWLNKNKFDYRGLIPMGIALEAPIEMYNFEK